jgi:DNA (cytosine-5)-methyltransferase 1
MKAIEFFSGIGAFAQAGRRHGIEVMTAFDQSVEANAVYALNHRLQPQIRNLDTIKSGHIPSADVWWLSPPCKPYSLRGKQRDDKDTRAASLKTLIALLPDHQPDVFLLENVSAFAGSAMHGRLVAQLQALGYALHQLQLCPTMFGVPMRRPRLFIVGKRSGGAYREQPLPPIKQLPLSNYLNGDCNENLGLDSQTLEKYGQGFDIVNEQDQKATAICFTSGYGKCMKVSGSLLRDRQGLIRRFSPTEMLRLFGFDETFIMPADMSLNIKWRLIANSIEQSCLHHLLSGLQR